MCAEFTGILKFVAQLEEHEYTYYMNIYVYMSTQDGQNKPTYVVITTDKVRDSGYGEIKLCSYWLKIYKYYCFSGRSALRQVVVTLLRSMQDQEIPTKKCFSSCELNIFELNFLLQGCQIYN